MALTYSKIAHKPKIFLRLTGVTVKNFQQIINNVSAGWAKIESKKKSHGRTSNLAMLTDKILALLIYYRTYILHNSNICRLFKVLEPLLANKITIKKDKTDLATF